MSEEFEIGLGAVLEALQPYAQDLVLVGGWVPVLYARHLRLQGRAPMFTRDIDVAAPRVLRQRERTVDELLKDAGLKDRFKSQLQPPAVSYVGHLDGTDVEVEFLTNEPGNREGTREVQAGLYATGLHYVDLLMERAFAVEVELGGRRLSVRIPSPASFIVQKSLVFPERPDPEKQAKDLYYAFDVWDRCREWRDWISIEAAGTRERRKSWMRRAIRNLDQALEAHEGEGVRMLVEQRPSAAFPEMDDDQFGQYAWGEMESLRAVLRA